ARSTRAPGTAPASEASTVDLPIPGGPTTRTLAPPTRWVRARSTTPSRPTGAGARRWLTTAGACRTVRLGVEGTRPRSAVTVDRCPHASRMWGILVYRDVLVETYR